MTFTADPGHRAYAVESDVRADIARTQDVCQSCRRCVDRCVSFSSLFDLLDRLDEPDAGLLTPAQQDQVLEACVQCGGCTTDCPHTPELVSPGVDVPSLGLRAAAMRRKNGHLVGADRRAARTLGHADRLARLARRVSGVSRWLIQAPGGSSRRRWITAFAGVSATRPLGTFSSPQLSVRCGDRPPLEGAKRSVRLHRSCLIEHQEPGVGEDAIQVFERNQISCQLSSAECCGAPLLHAGDVRRFAATARRNVELLAAEIRSGTDLVVAESGCVEMMREHYPIHVGDRLRDDAALVAAHTFDVAGYLVDAHRAGDITIDDAVVEPVGDVVHHPARPGGREAGGELLAAVGARVRSLSSPLASDGLWSRRSGHDGVAAASAARLLAEIGDTDELLAVDGAVARAEIAAATGRPVMHPIEAVARSYGIDRHTDD